MYVRRGSTFSIIFVSYQVELPNGIHQGGILSPILVNLYMNNLTIRLTDSGIGGTLGSKFVNNMIYAEDL